MTEISAAAQVEVYQDDSAQAEPAAEDGSGDSGEADSSAITEHVKNIRAKFRMTGLEPLETVWGIGYRWKG